LKRTPTPGNGTYNPRSRRKTPGCRKRSALAGITNTHPLMLLGKLSCRRHVAGISSEIPRPGQPQQGVNPTLRCSYHQSIRHSTEECTKVCDIIEELVQSGALARFVQRSPPREKSPDFLGPEVVVEAAIKVLGGRHGWFQKEIRRESAKPRRRVA